MQSDVLNIGVRAANDIIGTGMSEQEAKQELEQASQKAVAVVNDCAANVKNILETMIKNAELNLGEREQSRLARDVMHDNLPQVYTGEGEKRADYGDITEKMSKVGDFLVRHSAQEGVSSVFGAGLKSFSGTGVHQGILTVGKTLGFKFKPWQAVNLTKNVAMFGKVLGVVGVLYQIYQLAQSKEEEEKQQKKMDEARTEIREQFEKWANSAYSEIAGQARAQVAAIMDQPQELLANDLILIDDTRKKMDAVQPTVKKLQDEILLMLGELEEYRS